MKHLGPTEGVTYLGVDSVIRDYQGLPKLLMGVFRSYLGYLRVA
jgi:hypothetical protein